MRKIELLLVIALIVFTGRAQNLVPNCSFEDTSGCPNGGLGWIEYATGWFSCEREVISSPDYFFNCGGYTMVPRRLQGAYQYPATGNAYVGIIPWTVGYFNTLYDTREFIAIKLRMPLETGQTYFVSFKVNLAIAFNVGYASNNLGLIFSTVPHDTTHPPPINNFAHVYSDEIISDTINWTMISDWFVADSAYEYICIGNFFEDINTDTVRMKPRTNWDSISYYFIDDVCVSKDSTKCSCDSINATASLTNWSDIHVYPNPTSNVLHIDFNTIGKEGSLVMFNVFGREVKREKFSNGIIVNTRDIANGVYFLKIITNKKEFSQSIIIHH